ncbi:hypothetical protein KC19_11G011300 [Ceratodon purpureus]|uniref:Uncharacterized protein n=1 Tax=Ceratodon purpureus TaxID=3225 RepID=A0A8T0G9N8_CERPU|nr:hypothetical protein KC19_11G011300 [Ceratodon purpureus]
MGHSPGIHSSHRFMMECHFKWDGTRWLLSFGGVRMGESTRFRKEEIGVNIGNEFHEFLLAALKAGLDIVRAGMGPLPSFVEAEIMILNLLRIVALSSGRAGMVRFFN